MTSRLTLYQGAALILGDAKPVSLTENIAIRKDLDGVWDRGGVKSCLQKSLWNHATRGVQIDFSPSITPTFGYTRGFEKPDDYVRLVSLCADEFFRVPLFDYTDEASHLFCDLDTIYLRYVSDDVSYGFDFSKWPENFTRYVEHFFAHAVAKRITQSGRTKAEIALDMVAALNSAKATDAAEDPVSYRPPGTWSRARAGDRGRRRWLGNLND